MDFFEVFGLPRRLQVDREELQRRFYTLSRLHHPDVHHAAPPEQQAAALAASAQLNAAYRTLRDPVARIEYLVRLEEGRETREGAATRTPAPPELLEEMFEIQEALAEAQAGGLDDGARATLGAERARLRARCREEEARLTGPLADAWDAASPGERGELLEALKRSLAARSYLSTVLDDLGTALGDPEARPTHAAHHRD